MLPRLVIWILLVPMLLNGLWMVCNPAGAADSPAHSRESADCIRICAALEAVLGRICLVLPGDAKASISIIDYGAATLPSEILLQPITTDEQLAAELSAPYGEPSLGNLTPPPRA